MRPLAAPLDPFGLLGRTLDGRYLVSAALSGGDTGVVYRGEVIASRAPCAIKVLRPEIQRDPSHLQPILHGCRQAMRAGSLRLVVAGDILETDGWTAIVTPLLVGEDLAARLRRAGRMPWAHARELVLQLCAALRELHGAGLVFGGLKPSNVFLTGDSIYLLDVGVSRHDPRTGDPADISPEQITGAPADARSDLYSLSALTFELLTGRPPFVGVPAQVLAMHRHRPADSPSAVAPDAAIPADIDALLIAGLAKEPSARPELAAFTAVVERTTAASVHAAPSAEPATQTISLSPRPGRSAVSFRTAGSPVDEESTTQFFRIPPDRAEQSGVLDDIDQITLDRVRPRPAPASPPPVKPPSTPHPSPTPAPTAERTQFSPALAPSPAPVASLAKAAPGNTRLSPALAASSAAPPLAGSPPVDRPRLSPASATTPPSSERTQLSPALSGPTPHTSSFDPPPLVSPRSGAAQPAPPRPAPLAGAERTQLSPAPSPRPRDPSNPGEPQQRTEVIGLLAPVPGEHTQTAVISGFGGAVLGADASPPGHDLLARRDPAPSPPPAPSRLWARLRALFPARAVPEADARPGFWARFRRAPANTRLPARRTPPWLESALRALAAFPRKIGAVWRLAARPFANATALRSRFAGPLHAVRSSFTRLGRMLARFTGGGNP